MLALVLLAGTAGTRLEASGQRPGSQGQGSVLVQEVYRCNHVRADKLAAALKEAFQGEQLRIVLGPEPFSPKLGTTNIGGGERSVAYQAMDQLVSSDAGVSTRELILIGDELLVARAVDLAEILDHHRDQVRINMSITDINVRAARELGILWNSSLQFGIAEDIPTEGSKTKIDGRDSVPDFTFGTFSRTPLSLSATIRALEEKGDAKLLAQPSLSILDGERGFIFIGEKVFYTTISNQNSLGNYNYDTRQEQVGIYVQVAAHMSEHGDLILSIYPQVSTIVGYKDFPNGTSLPQIATRQQQTTIRARAGESIVLGGLIRDEELASLTAVPLLSRIPLIGELFKFRRNTKDRTDLVIMLTPEIIPDTHDDRPAAPSGDHQHPAEGAAPDPTKKVVPVKKKDQDGTRRSP